jgi:hypothetical protein
MWLHPDPGQALDLAVRLCAVSQLIGLLELTLVRTELTAGGFLDWSMIGILSPRTRTRAGSLIRRAFRRLGDRAFIGAVALNVVVACALLAWPSVTVLIAAGGVLHLVLVKRHHMTVDGSDQMMLVVLLTCLLGRIGGTADAARAAVTFLAAELTLSYLVAGLAKAFSPYWQSGKAFAMIAQTRMYGHPVAACVVRSRPAVGHVATWAVICGESLFVLGLTSPLPFLIAVLVAAAGFHIGCAVVMGLNRFLWTFAAGYPAVVCTNLAIRGSLGGRTADARRTRSRSLWQ